MICTCDLNALKRFTYKVTYAGSVITGTRESYLFFCINEINVFSVLRVRMCEGRTVALESWIVRAAKIKKDAVKGLVAFQRMTLPVKS